MKLRLLTFALIAAFALTLLPADVDAGTQSLGSVLYTQGGSTWTTQFVTTLFPAGADDDLDSELADDFEVPADTTWHIDGVKAPGQDFGEDMDYYPATVNVTFYNNSGGLPGSVACNYDAIPVTSYSAVMDLTVELPTDCTLGTGHYWFAIQTIATLSDNSIEGWFWRSAGGVLYGNEAAWRNPPDGWGTGCTSWAAVSTCASGQYDRLFTLYGSTEAGAAPPAIQVPNEGEIMISAAAPVVAYDGPGGNPVAIGPDQALVLPNDADGNGFDTHVITDTQVVDGETWYAIFIGSPDWVWVPASQVTVTR